MLLHIVMEGGSRWGNRRSMELNGSHRNLHEALGLGKIGRFGEWE